GVERPFHDHAVAALEVKGLVLGVASQIANGEVCEDQIKPWCWATIVVVPRKASDVAAVQLSREEKHLAALADLFFQDGGAAFVAVRIIGVTDNHRQLVARLDVPIAASLRQAR